MTGQIAHRAPDPLDVSPLVTSRLVLWATLGVCALLILVSAVLFQAPELLGRDKTLTDFDAFYLAGQMALKGHAGDAYHIDTMMAAQRQFSGTQSFLPWTYPPPFTLVVGALAILPIGLGYALFITASLALYLLVLRRIAGDALPGVLIAILPLLVLIVRSGQNGFLTGGLIGLFLLALIARRAGAGLPLGLMIIKPHLAAAMALMAVVERRWGAVMIAAGVVIVALALATVILGPAIWLAFLDGVRESGVFLAKGHYPLFRMTSLYAALRSFGVAADMALMLHAAGAVAVIAALLLVWRRGLPPRFLAASTCIATLFISPYNYDYDLAILGVGIAFVLRDVISITRPAEQASLLALCWLGTGYGLVAGVIDESTSTAVELGTSNSMLSLMGPAVLTLTALTAWLLHRRLVEK